MVTSVTSLGRNGLSDWLIQRVSAAILAVYTVVVLGWLITQGEVTYDAWSGFMGCLLMQIANTDRKSTRLNSSHVKRSRMPSSA